MNRLYTYILCFLFACSSGAILLSCNPWDLPTKKTQRICEKPGGTLTQKAQERKVDFSISDAKGTIDQVIWNFGNGATATTTGTTVTYTYPVSGTFTASATLTNTCNNITTLSTVVIAVNIVAPSFSIVKPSSAGVSTASVNFVVNNYGNPAAVEYGICYSSTINTPEIKNSTVVPVATPEIGVNTVVNLPNLAPSTTYYYQAYAKLPSGAIVYSSPVESFTTQADPLLQDLIASVSFTNQSLLDVSGYNNHVKLVGTTFTADRKGNASSAILLNGAGDYFYMPENGTLNPEALSISIWIKPAVVPVGVDGRMQIYNKSRFSDGLPQTYSSLIKAENDIGPALTFMTDIKQNSNCVGGVGWESLGFTSSVDLSKWHHLVFTYSGTSARMYFDGAELNVKTDLSANGIDKCPGGELKFGAQYQSLPWYFKGAMDDIRIYKRALTASEVQTLLNQ